MCISGTPFAVLGSFACQKIKGHHPPICNGPRGILKEHPSLCVLSVLLAGEAGDRTVEKWKFLPTCVHESPGLGASELSFLPGCAQREDYMRIGPTAWQTAHSAGP